MVLMVLRMGVRRNNSFYIRAGQLSFAPLFHRSSSLIKICIDRSTQQVSGIKLFEFEAHVNLVGFEANFYGLHGKNETLIFKATRAKGIEINSQMLP